MTSTLMGAEGPERPEFTDPPPDPLALAAQWTDEAERGGGVSEPLAAVLSTTDADGRPSARVVAVKDVRADGFVFGTSTEGRKGPGLNHPVALTFHWPETMQQLRVGGSARVSEPEDSDAVFEERTLESQAATAAARQSALLEDEQLLHSTAERLAAQARESGTSIPRPATWHAYLVEPDEIEFWHGRRDRLHRRLQYRRTHRHRVGGPPPAALNRHQDLVEDRLWSS